MIQWLRRDVYGAPDERTEAGGQPPEVPVCDERRSQEPARLLQRLHQEGTPLQHLPPGALQCRRQKGHHPEADSPEMSGAAATGHGRRQRQLSVRTLRRQVPSLPQQRHGLHHCRETPESSETEASRHSHERE